MLVAAVLCCAAASVSCKKDSEDSLADKLMGRWMVEAANGNPIPTDEKLVVNFTSPTQAYLSALYSADPAFREVKMQKQVNDVVIDGNSVSLTHRYTLQTVMKTTFQIYTVSQIYTVHKEAFDADQALDLTLKEEEIHTVQKSVRYVKVDKDESQSIIGTWQGRCTSDGSAYDDGEEHRWQYLPDGSFVYYVKDGDNWVPGENTVSEYFVDGVLLCTRWESGELEFQEAWEVSINDSQMNWRALRQREDGSTFTVTFEMNRIL